MRQTLHWICGSPSPYNSFLFRTLAAQPDIDLTVHFIRPSLETHPWQSEMGGFKSRTYQRVLGLDWHLLRLAAYDWRSFFVVAGWNEPTMIVLLNLLSTSRRQFAIWTDTPSLSRKRHPLKSYPRTIWLRWLFARATRVMGTGLPALSVLRQMGCPERHLVNFPYFVDIMAYPARPEIIKRQSLVFASSGRLHADKGYDIALSALARVYRGRPDRFKYKLAGTGPAAEKLARQAHELGIDESVEFLGWLEPSELTYFHATADVFLHPARVEPYGVAVLEAMASGLIVIGSDATGAVLDRIQSGVNGFVHRSDNVDDLVKRIFEVVDHAENMAPIQIAARQTAEEWPVSRGVNVIKQMLANCRKFTLKRE
jgi:glycosyltransferase involved in cell wall biosynthesis